MTPGSPGTGIGATRWAMDRGEHNREILGWREWASLPDLGISSIKLKVDTGARTSALHVRKVHYENLAGGQRLVRFLVHPIQHDEEVELECSALLLEKRWVKSSLGHRTLRPVIRTRIRIGSREKEIELSLINRDLMGFRMLLGRQALRHDFLVNPAASFLSGDHAALESVYDL